MRKTICFVAVVLLCTGLFAQQNIDSLRRLLLHAKEDTTRIDLMNQIADNYVLSKPDSAYKYAADALILSRKVNDKTGEAEAIRNVGTALSFLNDFSRALEYLLDALKRSEALGNKKMMALCLNGLGIMYGNQGDSQRAMEYFFKAKNIYDQLHADDGLRRVLLNIGNAYLNFAQLDSSRTYFSQALEIALRAKDDVIVAAIYVNLGYVYSQMKQFDVATAYFQQTVPTFTAHNNHFFLNASYQGLSGIFHLTQQYDSALYYGRLAWQNADIIASPQPLAQTAKRLVSLFKKTAQLDSVFFYLDREVAARDSLGSRENENKIRLLTFNEQLRQMDIAEQKRKEAEARKRNLELAGIAIFIPSFFFLVLVLGRIKVRSRTVEFLGVLSLLFLFEFIVLFIHPYLGHWTHESPVWMLLTLVTIAAILVPLHDRMEKWMKEKLTAKPKEKLRAETAEPGLIEEI
jgi:tetratricopeptide (TPR) repeat protein